MFILTPSLPLFFSFLLLLLLRVEQFVCLGVRWVLHSLDFLFDLVGRVEASTAQFAVDAFGVSVPVVAGHADNVAGLQGNVFTVARLVGVDGDLVVGVLTSKVVNIIQGVEEGGGVWMQRLHNLVGHTADLRQTEAGIIFIFRSINGEEFILMRMLWWYMNTVVEGQKDFSL